jgi:hypothetical protein
VENLRAAIVGVFVTRDVGLGQVRVLRIGTADCVLFYCASFSQIETLQLYVFQ